MIARYKALAQRIRQEFEEIERTIAAVHRHWQRSKTATTDQDAYLNSVALNLHSFYSGLERIFELVASDVDGTRLGGERWHIEMLRQMTLELERVRPVVIDSTTASKLDDYRRFRHLVRNIYTTNLKPSEMEKLVDGLDTLWQALRQQLDTFISFLEAQAHADEG